MTLARAFEAWRRPVTTASPAESASLTVSNQISEATLSASKTAIASNPPHSRTRETPQARTSPLPELGVVFSQTVAPASRANAAVASVQLSAITMISRRSAGQRAARRLPIGRRMTRSSLRAQIRMAKRRRRSAFGNGLVLRKRPTRTRSVDQKNTRDSVRQRASRIMPVIGQLSFSIMPPPAVAPKILFGIRADRLLEAVVQDLRAGEEVVRLREPEGSAADKAVTERRDANERPGDDRAAAAHRQARRGREGLGLASEEHQHRAPGGVLVHQDRQIGR